MHILLDPAARPVVGHRGNAAHAPENTLESIDQGLAAGADAVEFDVHLSADGVPVVVHDPTVDRTTDGRGPVASMTVSELRRLDAGARFTRDGGRTFPYRGRGIGIPTLDEVVERHPDAQLLIEIKTPRASAAVRRVLEAHRADERAIVASFSAEGMTAFADSRIRRGCTQPECARAIANALGGRRQRSLPYSVMCVPRTRYGVPLPIGALSKSVAPAGCLIHVWTVDEPAHARRLWSLGARGIISNDPALILETRAAMLGAESRAPGQAGRDELR